MSYTPIDILDYVIENELDSAFISSLMMNKNNFSIAEIPDKRLVDKNDEVYLRSKAYSINLKIEDPEIIAACRKNMYISVFIARKDDDYAVHFFVHKCTNDEKSMNEDLITHEVVQYMILKTIISLRLDTIEKVKNYCG